MKNCKETKQKERKRNIQELLKYFLTAYEEHLKNTNNIFLPELATVLNLLYKKSKIGINEYFLLNKIFFLKHKPKRSIWSLIYLRFTENKFWYNKKKDDFNSILNTKKKTINYIKKVIKYYEKNI